MSEKTVALLLDNIRSVHNVGSIFRTAECVGVNKIYCIGTTPAPVDRFGRRRCDFAKVSLGSEDMLEWEHVTDEASLELVKCLKQEGYKIVAVEQAPSSVNYKKVKLADKTALILGNEVDGVRAQLLKMADEIAEIPMKGQKESLNVSVATGVVLFHWLG